MKKIVLLFILSAGAFAACREQGDDLDLSDKERAYVLAYRADELFYGEEGRLVTSPDSSPDITRVLAAIDAAISYDPENTLYRYKKVLYLKGTYQEESMRNVLREILARNGEDLSAVELLGKSFARTGERDSAKVYLDRAIELWRKNRVSSLAPAFVDSAHVALYECYITGDREAAIRKIEQSADTARMSESEKVRLRQVIEDFDMNLDWLEH